MDFKKLEYLLSYEFKDKKLLTIALTHKSMPKKQNNERLEFLGDAVLDLVVANFLFNEFKDVAEGDLSKIRAALVNEKSFANLARNLNLGDFLILAASEDSNCGREKDSILSDAFEAIFGVIYLESGIEICKKIAINLIKKVYPNISLSALGKDYKTALQELTQAKFGFIPEYKLISQAGPDHKKIFEVEIMIGNEKYAKATGKSKKDAQQNAAKLTLLMLEK